MATGYDWDGRLFSSSGDAPGGDSASDAALPGTTIPKTEAAKLVRAAVDLEDDEVFRGIRTAEEQEDEEVDGPETSGLRERLTEL